MDNKERLFSIINALSSLDSHTILPLHPRAGKMIHRFGLDDVISNSSQIKIIEAVGYRDSLALIANARMVITDSGGVLREAFFNSIHSICIDDSTEWYDLVLSGWSHLTGAATDNIKGAMTKDRPASKPDLFGDGHASSKTIEALRQCVN